MERRLLYSPGKLSLKYLNNLIEQNVWKAFASIHAGIQHQLKIILRYKFNKDEKGNALGGHALKWKIINDKLFGILINDLYVVGIIDDKLKDKLRTFNNDRNKKLGHINIYDKKDISDNTLKKICVRGVEIMKELDEIIKKIFFPMAK